MGQCKNYLNECESRGYWSKNTYVCSECVKDKFLIEVNNNLESENCNYCDSESEELIAAPFDTVMDHIYNSIRNEYSAAQDIDLPWAEGEYILEETDSEEILSEFDPDWPSKYREDIRESLIGDYWINCPQGEWYAIDKSISLSYDWNKFKNQVISKTRYLFLSEPYIEDDYCEDDSVPVSLMLDKLGKLVNKLGLISSIHSETKFFRVRASENRIIGFDDIGVPPAKKSNAGRMNPAGIPYLYLAFDENTAVSETITNEDKYCLARFILNKDLNVLDLSSIPCLPSKFNASAYNRRCELIFIRNFLIDLSKPIEKDGREHVDYVPTQIVSEYFRHRFKDGQGNSVDGIMYSSAKNKNGVNLALFVSENTEAKKLLTLELIRQFKSEVKYQEVFQ
jgi:hypothetical protein